MKKELSFKGEISFEWENEHWRMPRVHSFDLKSKGKIYIMMLGDKDHFSGRKPIFFSVWKTKTYGLALMLTMKWLSMNTFSLCRV